MQKVAFIIKFIILAVVSVASTWLITTSVLNPQAAAPLTPTPQPPDDVQIAVVPDPTPTQPAPEPPEPVTMAADDGCVTCHTDQEMLISTAKEEEEVEHLSEGEG